jgi:hypothetical protein
MRHVINIRVQMSGGNERNERGGGWHDGVINALPFHIEIHGSQMCEKTRTGMISDLARAQSGHQRACGMELVSLMQGARFGQQGVGRGLHATS